MNKRILDDITQFIFVSDAPRSSDIIFIPGGSHPELGECAADLYKQGYAELLMPSGGVSVKTGRFGGVKSRREKYGKDYLTDCDFLVDVLKINGVPENAILTENTSGFTKENALFSRKVADEAGIVINSAILCCKNFHARRSLLCYQFAFPKTRFLVVPVPYFAGDVEITAENWFQTEVGIRRVLGELRRCGNQFEEEFVSRLGQFG